MPVKLIIFLISIVVAVFFIGFNIENRCDVSFVFHTFRDVPIVISLVTAYVIGSLSVIPFLVGRKRKKKNAPVKEKKEPAAEKAPKQEQTR